MKYILLLILCGYCLRISAQTIDTWTAFWNSDTTLFGFKDAKGTIVIPPKFNPFSTATSFDDIIAVVEGDGDTAKPYYLTKAGKIAATDSLYMFDNTPDCENEGFIRFYDKKTDQTGLLDRSGTVVIPAMYSELSRVTNGVLCGLLNAEKKCADPDCEHYNRYGGTWVLLDTTNTTLIDNFNDSAAINFYSLVKSTNPSPDSIRLSFKAKDGSYYSFIDYNKEFRTWLLSEICKNPTPQKLTLISHPTLQYETSDGWVAIDRNNFIRKHHKLLKKEFKKLLDVKTDHFMTIGGLNPYIYTSTEFKVCFNNCGEAREWKYPLVTLVVNHLNKGEPVQNYYEFLRTDDGYKLVGAVVRCKEIR
jgi:WG containing repeat